MRKPRRNPSAAFKARVALETIRGEKTVAEIVAHHQVHPNRLLHRALAAQYKTDVPSGAA